jgi:hypothetical protein
MSALAQHHGTTPPPLGDGIEAVLRDLTGTAFGGLLAWGLTCALAGAIPVLISEGGMIQPAVALGFAWMLHLIVAGIGVVGIFFILLHAWCLHSLIFTEDSRSRALAGAFLCQFTVSVIANSLLREDLSASSIAAWALATALLLPFVLRPLFRSSPRTARSPKVQSEGDRGKLGSVAIRRKSPTQNLPSFLRRRMEERARVTRILRSKVGRFYSGKDERFPGTSPHSAKHYLGEEP